MFTITFLTLLGFLILPFTYSQAPTNDDCVNATVIPSNVTLPYTTDPIPFKNATYNILDPITSCNYTSLDFPKGTDGATMWYTFTPNATGLYAVSTIESTLDSEKDYGGNFSAIIGIFVGNTCGSLQEITCSIYQIGVTSVSLDQGKTYFIKVGTFDDELGGQLKLTVKPGIPSPPNTQCDSAISIDAITGQVVSESIDVAFTNSEYDECGWSNRQTQGLWYKVTNALTIPLSIVASTCNNGTDFDTTITVFKGNDCESLECIGRNDMTAENCGTSSMFTFLAAEQSSYYILIGGYVRYDDIYSDSVTGNFTLAVNGSSNYFLVVDSKSNKAIDVLGPTISYESTPSSKLNIQAVFAEGTPIQSVQMTFDNPARSFCEAFAPYSLFGDTGGDFFDGTIPIGEHTVTATSYAQSGCNGPTGTSISSTFDMTGCFPYFVAYEADTHQLMHIFTDFTEDDPQYGNIVDSFPCKVNIEAGTFMCGFRPTTVQIDLRNAITNKIIHSQTELESPYYLFGNDGDKLNSGVIGPGTYNISATVDGIKHPDLQFKVLNACYEI